MGRPKAGLPLTDRADTFLSRIVRTLTAAGLPHIVVVTGCAADAVRAAAGRARRHVTFAHNERWATGQLSSLLTGLDGRSGDVVEAVLVALVDAPLVSAATIADVVRTWRRTRALIVRPAHGDVHGHPVIFDGALFEDLRAADPHAGAKSIVRAREAAIVNVPVDDPGAFIDIDTEQDYRDVLRELQR
jgi:molybdenum cofactor cytidylyltransferase